MSPETLVLALPIAISLHIVRGNYSRVAQLWGAARWYERLALLLLFVPIPGPIDEIVALLAIRRILARSRP